MVEKYNEPFTSCLQLTVMRVIKYATPEKTQNSRVVDSRSKVTASAGILLIEVDEPLFGETVSSRSPRVLTALPVLVINTV